VAVAYSIWHLLTYFHLPQPFFYEYVDTWMDWFNPAYWAHQPGTYDNYRTIYPPLSYVLLKFMTYGPCYEGAEGGWSRDCDVYGVAWLHLIYLANVIVTFAVFRKIDRRTAIPRTVAMALGLPMLWGLGRGNLVLIAYFFLLLAYGPLIRSARLRWLFVGMAINMKVYLVGTLFAQLIHHRWRWFEGAALATVAVYLISFIIFGEGSPAVIFENLTEFGDKLEINNPLDLWMASSLKPLGALLQSSIYPVTLYVGSQLAELGIAVLPWITRICQAIIFAAAAAATWRPNAIPRSRMIVLSVGVAIMSTEVSGYTQTLVFAFAFMEPFKGVLRRYAIIMCYILSIPADITIDRLPPIVAESFLGGRPVFVHYVVQLGPFVRPILTMSIPVALALLTLIEVRKYYLRSQQPAAESARLAARPAW
jgi:hypothetical protein